MILVSSPPTLAPPPAWLSYFCSSLSATSRYWSPSATGSLSLSSTRCAFGYCQLSCSRSGRSWLSRWGCLIRPIGPTLLGTCRCCIWGHLHYFARIAWCRLWYYFRPIFSTGWDWLGSFGGYCILSWIRFACRFCWWGWDLCWWGADFVHCRSSKIWWYWWTGRAGWAGKVLIGMIWRVYHACSICAEWEIWIAWVRGYFCDRNSCYSSAKATLYNLQSIPYIRNETNNPHQKLQRYRINSLLKTSQEI